MVATTLGTTRDAQIIDALEGERREPSCCTTTPPFSVGETGMMIPKRREIGHGNLARRGVNAVMPDMTVFPYVIRVCRKSSSPTARVHGERVRHLAVADGRRVADKGAGAGVAWAWCWKAAVTRCSPNILATEDHLGRHGFKCRRTKDA